MVGAVDLIGGRARNVGRLVNASQVDTGTDVTGN